MFVHVVFMRFQEQSSIMTAKDRLESLLELVPSIQSLEVGIDVVHSARSWDLVLITRFEHEEGYKEYAVDPDHKTVLKWLKNQLLESATVDYVQ
jgi:hypothetical protein